MMIKFNVTKNDYNIDREFVRVLAEFLIDLEYQHNPGAGLVLEKPVLNKDHIETIAQIASLSLAFMRFPPKHAEFCQQWTRQNLRKEWWLKAFWHLEKVDNDFEVPAFYTVFIGSLTNGTNLVLAEKFSHMGPTEGSDSGLVLSDEELIAITSRGLKN